MRRDIGIALDQPDTLPSSMTGAVPGCALTAMVIMTITIAIVAMPRLPTAMMSARRTTDPCSLTNVPESLRLYGLAANYDLPGYQTGRP